MPCSLINGCGTTLLFIARTKQHWLLAFSIEREEEGQGLLLTVHRGFSISA
jgi:hypothetical protein